MFIDDALKRIPGPFPLAVTDQAVSGEGLARLDRLFTDAQRWARHEDHFYRCFIAEVDGQLPAPWLASLREAVGAALGLALGPQVRVTAQRMEAQDGSDPHTDRPQAGFEAARLVLQLDDAKGGSFRAFDGDQLWIHRPARRNQAVAFELCGTSWHEVTPCRGLRRTVVFHFWHRANPPGAREALDSLLGAWSVRDLPSALAPWMDAAEARAPEELTGIAGAVAWLLQRWGRPIEEVIAGYRAVVEGLPGSPAADLAEYLVRMRREGFDRRAAQALAARGIDPCVEADLG